MKLGTRVNDVLLRLLVLPEGRAVDPTMNGYGTTISTGKGGHGTHKARGSAPSGAFDGLEERAPVVKWAERISRILDAAERECEAYERGAQATGPAQDKVSDRKRGEDRSILADYVGEDPTTVAYIFRRTTEGVRKLRQRNGLDPDTGERITRDVLTAHPRHYKP